MEPIEKTDHPSKIIRGHKIRLFLQNLKNKLPSLEFQQLYEIPCGHSVQTHIEQSNRSNNIRQGEHKISIQKKATYDSNRTLH